MSANATSGRMDGASRAIIRSPSAIVAIPILAGLRHQLRPDMRSGKDTPRMAEM
jgi:hypothetical protein